MLYLVSYVVVVRGPLVSNQHTFHEEYIEFKSLPTRKDLDDFKERITRTRIASDSAVTLLGVSPLAGE